MDGFVKGSAVLGVLDRVDVHLCGFIGEWKTFDHGYYGLNIYKEMFDFR